MTFEKKLEPALRQYRHSSVDNFIAAYDREETLKILNDMIAGYDNLRMENLDLKASLRTCANSAQGVLDQYKIK
ncbi:MAG: hypothetical protein JKY52_09155 [Flavobacteriales bacterium]|nr:hypothetical protein [Flavobacteriales bacterium]